MGRKAWDVHAANMSMKDKRVYSTKLVYHGRNGSKEVPCLSSCAKKDTLSRLSHDADICVAQNAVLALGECVLPLLVAFGVMMSKENRGLVHILKHVALCDMGPAAISCNICTAG